jgi:hypothetical protein
MPEYYVDRMTHTQLEDKVLEHFYKSPDYSIYNVAGYGSSEGYINIPGKPIHYAVPKPSLFLTPFNPLDKENNLWQRAKRFNKERLYVVHNDIFDKISTIAILVGAVLSLIVLYYSIPLGVEQVYQLSNPEDAKDPEKLKKLETLNKAWTGRTYVYSRAALIAIPGILTFWQIFKRTTIHKAGHDKRLNAHGLFKKAISYVRRENAANKVVAEDN